MKTLLIAAIMCASVVAMGNEARGESLKLCIRLNAVFEDNDVGEDYWLTDTYQYVRGARVKVVRDNYFWGPTVWSGTLGDGLGSGDNGAGCTPYLSLSNVDRTYYVVVYSDGGYVNYNDLTVLNGNDSPSSLVITYTHTSGSGIATLNSTYGGAVFRVYNAAAWALTRHHGGMAGNDYTLTLNAPNGSRYNRVGDQHVEIASSHTDNKFVIAHELGHRMWHLKAPDNYTEDACDDAADPVCPATGGSHSMGSKELAQCAHNEGLANFFSAMVWNYDGWNQGCKMKYWKPFDYNRDGVAESSPIIDCDVGSSYLKAMCTPSYTFWGTEFDWMRVLWNIRTDSSFGAPPNFTYMLTWMDNADPWNRLNTYQKLDDEAYEIGGPLWSLWSFYDHVMGINGD